MDKNYNGDNGGISSGDGTSANGSDNMSWSDGVYRSGSTSANGGYYRSDNISGNSANAQETYSAGSDAKKTDPGETGYYYNSETLNNATSAEGAAPARVSGWGGFLVKVLIAAGIIGCVAGLIVFFAARGAMNNSTSPVENNEVVAEENTDVVDEAETKAEEADNSVNTSVSSTEPVSATVIDVSDIV